MSDEVWLRKVADVAVRLQVSVATVYRLIEKGELEAVRIGRSVRVKEASLTDYIQRHGPGSKPAA